MRNESIFPAEQKSSPHPIRFECKLNHKVLGRLDIPSEPDHY